MLGAPRIHDDEEEVDATMCRAVKCRTCGKTTWAGCGQHVDQVLRRVPASQRCQGHPEPERRRQSVLRRLLSRS